MDWSTVPNPSLVAILLVTQSSSGTNFVFHYPPNPKIDSPVGPLAWGGDNTDDGHSTNTSSSTNSSDEEIDDQGTSDPETSGARKSHLDNSEFEGANSESDRRSRSYAGGRVSSRRHRDDNEEDDEEDDEPVKVESAGPPWENVFGFKTSFLASLLAPKSSMCRRKFELTIDDLVFLGYPVQIRPDGTWKKQRKRRKGRVADDEHDPGEDHKSEGTEEDKDGGGMSMFHVVFVMNPPQMEYHARVQEMYTYVVRKFAKALKQEQARANYVGRETEMILRMKEKAIQEGGFNCSRLPYIPFHDLWQQVLHSSSLASAITSVYAAISASKIAHVYINEEGLSLQLPIVLETSILPSLTEPQVPGLFLTTATSFDEDDADVDTIARHFTLLFLDERENIEREIEKEIMAEPTTFNSNLLYFVKHCKPTLSFVQIASQAGLPLAEVQVLAHHLIYWRRARAIPPISLRDYYIVSPNADMRKLSTQIPIYSRKFPTLPSLPKMLSSLSSRPRPFSSLIPSKDHRRAYLDILAWLLRHGWVTQLRTFGLLKIPKEIKQKVAKEQAILEQHRQQQQQQQQPQPEKAAESLPPATNVSQNTSTTNNPATSTNPTAAALQSSFVIDSSMAEEEFEDSFILEPQQASSIESAWMEMITRDQPPDVTAVFDRIARYLNGQNALEKIPVKEGISRKECKRVLHAMEKYICIVSIQFLSIFLGLHIFLFPFDSFSFICGGMHREHVTGGG
ncbi:nitrogen permease regulator of amino acid transport activity 3-domain-containing protein [Kalaharituber pfeilii]|nr:nitrogen permease regulator of amino acid transport activity 3-domain-containing protein [Kalaharituber pfeilii]